MVLWQGLTEGGTAVPVQVTEAGKVVAEGQQGQQGPQGPQGSEGPQGPPGQYSEGDDVVLGTGTFAGDVVVGDGGFANEDKTGVYLAAGAGFCNVYHSASASSDFLRFTKYDTSDPSGYTLQASISDDGSIKAAEKLDIGAGWDAGGSNTGGSRITDGSYYSQLPSSAKNTAVFTAIKGTSVNYQLNADGSVSFASNTCGFTSEGELYFTSRGTRYKLVVQGALCNAEPYTREMELRERAEDKRKPRTTDSVSED